MVTREIIKKERAQRVKNVTEGSACMTDFFDERHPMNENPTAPFHDFMNKHDMDFMKGKVKRRK